ncbi:ABC transporter ATP-binding protein [Micromonospora sp. WMMA2032]|uniref:Amino acid/amide ABC transporter ATP-binding protein 2, HAAT family n=1 Tax=Micromonospora sediminicola TaxID=946078 RepID=A0A1A9BER9_9ACTN|nr:MULTISPECIES: ABC transporter ATP-binding protein [Micromonospora]ATO13817.1 ABC transporter ATP-binding protein [Micromonospora sp. WMMA2032]PGH45542.1 ABC transporter ATP-binding protein [Micromonospora sp. WMMA1996]SBT67454.1 amino acid/amide ABC transporter ATP-binding protein 2, HAAT family [Micromonospora sediminicola]
MLRIENLSAWYGEAQVLREVSLEVAAGEVVTLVGRNGAGKSTLLRSVMGLHPGQRGAVHLDGRDISRLPAYRRARAGLGWVPDDRGAYATLTVTENLTLPPRVGPDPWPLERVYEAFPALHARRDSAATMLSGGEQQMLALARVLRMGARLLLCDEPTEGLSPLLVQQVGDLLREAKKHGVTVLLVEQNLHFATGVADRHYLLAEGRIAEAMENAEVRSRERELLAYLGI